MAHYSVVYSGSTPKEFREELCQHGMFNMIRISQDLWRLAGDCPVSATKEVELILLMTPHVMHFHRTSGREAGFDLHPDVAGSLVAFEDLGDTNTWSTEESDKSDLGEFDDFINDQVDEFGLPAEDIQFAQDPNWMDAFPVSASPEPPSFTSAEWQSAAKQAVRTSESLSTPGFSSNWGCSCTAQSAVPGCCYPHCPGVASMDQ